MTKRTKLAIVIALVLCVVAGFISFLLHSQKPVRHRQVPQPAEVVGIGIALRINTATFKCRFQTLLASCCPTF